MALRDPLPRISEKSLTIDERLIERKNRSLSATVRDFALAKPAQRPPEELLDMQKHRGGFSPRTGPLAI